MQSKRTPVPWEQSIGDYMKPRRNHADITISPAQVVALGSMGNQARLNNGCVCNGGCESCARLAETFEALHCALETVTNHLQAWDSSGDPRPATWAASRIKIARAALMLAGKVTP